jgi:putative lipoprotein
MSLNRYAMGIGCFLIVAAAICACTPSAPLLGREVKDAASSPTYREIRRWEMYRGRLREVVLLRGELVYGHEAHELTPCGGGDPYWVLDATGGDLPEVYRSMASQPYEPIFAEVRGMVIFEAGSGFGADFDRQVRVTELLRAAREGPGCAEDLSSLVFRAHGGEPFWHLEVTPDSLRLHRLGVASVAFHIDEISTSPIDESSEDASGFRWSGSHVGGGSITATIHSVRCIDTMSGSVFPYQATVSLDGTTLTGCAAKGGSRLP